VESCGLKGFNMAGSQEEKRNQLQKLMDRIRLTLLLIFDPRVDLGYKLIPLFTLLYILSPIDVMPEAALGPLGIFDDIGVLLLGLEMFIRMAPQHLVREYSRAQEGENQDLVGEKPKRKNEEPIIVEGTYRVRD
jgi:uncharacterized membrane protein YkvA (DUF1232 family)